MLIGLDDEQQVRHDYCKKGDVRRELDELTEKVCRLVHEVMADTSHPPFTPHPQARAKHDIEVQQEHERSIAFINV